MLRRATQTDHKNKSRSKRKKMHENNVDKHALGEAQKETEIALERAVLGDEQEIIESLQKKETKQISKTNVSLL